MDLRAHLAEHWPLFGLAVRTPRLELRFPTDPELLDLAALSTDIHDPGFRPFSIPWNEGTDDEVRRRLIQYHWTQRGAFTADGWRLELVTVVAGEVVGTQGLFAHQYPVSRTFTSGSWLGRRHHGAGIGTEMREAMLHLAFDGLAAERAITGAFEGNEASLAVTRKVGYRPNGDAIHVDGDERRRELKFVMDRADWQARRRDDVELVGLEPCLPLFGLGEA